MIRHLSPKKATKAMRMINMFLSVVFIAVIVFVTSVNNSEHTAYAQGSTPFGGQSTYVFYCTCSMSIAISINDLTQSSGVTQPLLYTPGSTTLYPYGQVFSSGVWLLGLWNSGGSCMYYVGTSCSSYTVAGTMSMVGTSM